MLKIEGLTVFINAGGGVTVARPADSRHPEVVCASHTPEALLLFAILQKLNEPAASAK